MIEESGTPRELAERMTRLPDGQYRMFVQRVRSRDEILADFDRATEEMRRNPSPEAMGKTEDEIMEFADSIIREVRQASRAAK